MLQNLKVVFIYEVSGKLILPNNAHCLSELIHSYT